jgi:hypothetical protein
MDHGMTVPRQVRCGFTRSGRSIEIGCDAAGRLVRRQALTVFGLADGDIRCRKVGQNRGTGHGGETGWGHRYPDVFAELDKERKAGDFFYLEEKIGTEGNPFLPAE